MTQPGTPSREITGIEAWARAVADLAAPGPLPQRTVVVPNERVAHSIRCALITQGQQQALLGTRFLPALSLAAEILDTHATPYLLDAAQCAPLLLRRIFEGKDLALEVLKQRELAQVAGWDRAFTRTLSELAADDLQPDALLASADPTTRDVGRIWHALQGSLQEHRFAGQVYSAATKLIQDASAPALVRPTLAVLDGSEPSAMRRFLQALPGVALLQRSPRAQTQASTGLERLQSHLLGRTLPSGVADDRSVEVVTFAGVVDEVDAAICWVAEQVQRGVPLQEIALLSPGGAHDFLLWEGLSRLPWPEGSQPGLLVQGLPLTHRSDGAHLLSLLDALHHNLPREAVLPLLCMLRNGEQERLVRDREQAVALLGTIATLGGNIAHPEGALTWKAAHRRALAHLQQACSTPDDSASRARAQQQALAGMLSLGEGLAALETVAEHVVRGAPMSELWLAVREFAENWLRLPARGAVALGLLDGELKPYLDDPELCGAAAIDILRDVLRDLRLREGRFGHPHVFLGPLRTARGLSFAAVRIVGLTEGSLPSNARQDALLDDDRRRALSATLRTSQDRQQQQLEALLDVIGSTRSTLALSTARQTPEGQRQPAAILLDVVACLQGSYQGVEAALSHRASTARRKWRTQRACLPLTERAWQERLAMGDGAPAHWPDDPCHPHATRALEERTQPGGQDGLAPGVVPVEQLAGLSPEHPISASALSTLLLCPHRYALSRVLGWAEPSALPGASAIDPMPFGTLLHAVAEEFGVTHGEQFSRRAGSLDDWIPKAHALADTHFQALLDHYPLSGSEVREVQRELLHAQVEKWLRYEWGRSTQFVAAERAFGYGAGVPLPAGEGLLYVHGNIDRLDCEDGVTLVRDLKTGKSKAQRGADEPPSPDPDLQIGVYAGVARAKASEWKLPAEVAASYVYLKAGRIERRWQAEGARALEQATAQWLATARDILEAGAFVRSPNSLDCTYCAFKPVCALESNAPERTIRDPRVPSRLRVLKNVEDTEPTRD